MAWYALSCRFSVGRDEPADNGAGWSGVAVLRVACASCCTLRDEGRALLEARVHKPQVRGPFSVVRVLQTLQQAPRGSTEQPGSLFRLFCLAGVSGTGPAVVPWLQRCPQRSSSTNPSLL